MISAFIYGSLLALGLILPLGVQNVFIFTQGACQGRFINVWPAVITASVCDTLLILAAVQGVSIVVLNFLWVRFLLLAIGVIFLAYMGLVTWRTRGLSANGLIGNESWPAKRQVVFALSVSLLNPHAIMDTIGVIGTSSISYLGSEKFAYTLACILVSWVWFIFLASAGRIFRTLDSSGRLFTVINRVSAVIMWGSAVYMGYLFSHMAS
jgi:L-lysine exporter family protein LysE/ArgO